MFKVDALVGQAVRIIVDPMLPRQNLVFDPDHKCMWATPEFRAQTNRWLLERFGTGPECYEVGSTLVVSLKAHDSLMKQMRDFMHDRLEVEITKAFRGSYAL